MSARAATRNEHANHRDYSHRTLAEKLGLRPDSVLTILNEPDGFRTTLGTLPERLRLLFNLEEQTTTVIWFVGSIEDLHRDLARVARLSDGRSIWIAYPKKSSGVRTDINESAVRNAALAEAMVDYKVCSIDAIWTGLLFTRRKK
jgi:hypothetical protein